ncbi:GAF domain-containing protein [Solirubrobacter ginsenosidimutans]|uniref:GAF domain-containing protein n=1 Tax=Solirubrobacter ginsenosidimutans TaxID=490573 RepID=A0A9X3MTA4_9ACTN|nr:helix-turn-helix domain-containing protein [Solirubrobacter ginsenosidimutans]MDA0162244.1 GAF domain-containing protein [Solirubrobacter ginsenosidimutans]
MRNPWLAVNPLGDRLAQAKALQRVHEAFHSGRDVGGSVRAVVAQSWARSSSAGVDPVTRAPIVLADEREIDERWSHHPLHPVLPVLRDLLSSATSESGHMLVISDAAGVLLWIEGHHRVIEATHDMHFVCGADWSESGAGTNALGTAIAVDHPVQIFSAEHYSRRVHPWQCSGAPIHDPATGEIIGVIDLTGHLKTAHPHTLSLVTAAAGMAEAFLRHDRDRRDERAREAYLERVGGARQRTALVRRNGQVLMGVPSGWLPSGFALEPGELALPDGTVADVEPLEDCLVVWQRSAGGRREPHAPVRLDLLRRRPLLHRPGETVPLSGRHAEILCTLLLAPDGLTVEELTHEIYADGGKPVTLRAEMSRLRSALGGLITARPYRFAIPVTSDLQEVETLLANGHTDEARQLARGRLLPGSHAPRVVEARERLEHALSA